MAWFRRTLDSELERTIKGFEKVDRRKAELTRKRRKREMKEIDRSDRSRRNERVRVHHYERPFLPYQNVFLDRILPLAGIAATALFFLKPGCTDAIHIPLNEGNEVMSTYENTLKDRIDNLADQTIAHFEAMSAVVYDKVQKYFAGQGVLF